MVLFFIKQKPIDKNNLVMNKTALKNSESFCKEKNIQTANGKFNRRQFIISTGLLSSIPYLFVDVANGQTEIEQTLPLKTPGLDHLDIIVPDVDVSTRFYMGVFRTTLHAQPFQGGLRYFVLLGELPENRQVAYLAIGESRGRGTYIGHFCTSVDNFREYSQKISDEISKEVERAGLGDFTGFNGFGGIFSDPDGIEIQFLPAPDVLVDAAIPSTLVEGGGGLVTPKGLDHVKLHVSNLAEAEKFYSILYGQAGRYETNPDQVWFDFRDTSLLLEAAPYLYGQHPKIAHFCIKVEPFDRSTVEAGLVGLGAKIISANEEKDILRFIDPDGITIEIKMVAF